MGPNGWITSVLFLAFGTASACSLAVPLDDYQGNVADEREPGTSELGDGGSPSAGGAAGSAGATSSEICGDGLDGDGDGAVDCADSDCTNARWSCVPDIPGWQGPVAFHRGPYAVDAPPCAAPYDASLEDAQAALTFAPASCTCECAAPSGVSCSVPLVEFHDSTSCSGTLCVSKAGPAEQCLDGAGTCGAQADSLSVGPSLPSGGGCVASSTPPSIPPYAWETRVRTCATAALGQGGCAANELCAPPPPKSHASELCVHAEGDLECPPEYPAKQLVHGAAADDRGCSACSCGAPQNVACSAKVRWWVGSCGGLPDGEAVAPTACTPTGPVTPDYEYAFEVETPVALGGSCAPNGGLPIGGVQPLNPRTVCCAE